MGIVRLGIITTLALVPRYRGKTTATSWPCATSAFGNASTTSARPPVFENGSPSEATKRILTLGSLLESLDGFRVLFFFGAFTALIAWCAFILRYWRRFLPSRHKRP